MTDTSTPPADVAAKVQVPAQRPESDSAESADSGGAVAAAGDSGGAVAAAEDRVGEVVERAAAVSGRVASAVVERLRNEGSLTSERGSTTIGDEVVEKIAGIATRGVPGVHDLGGDVARVFAGLRERVGLGDADDDTDRGVKVRLESDKATVEITLVIEYGQVVRTVTDAVRTAVISAVETMLSLRVIEVNIRVDDVHVPEA